MQPSLKVNNDLSNLGMSKSHLKLQKEGDHPPLSPKEIWLRKEKQLKMKGVILLISTQLFWLLLFSASDTEAPIIENKIQLESEHQLIKLPSVIYSQIPSQGQKIAVTLVQKGTKKTIPAYLRSIEEDPMGESGIKALLEVPQNQLHYIKNHPKTWQVFPPMGKQVQKQRSIYEINF